MLPQRVDLVLNSIDHLRPMPSSVTRILKEIDNPYISVSVISQYIGLDQALTALVLQASNTAALGFGQPCITINDAVVRIGFKRLKSILMVSAAAGPLTRRLSGYRLGAGQLWDHSLRIAIAAEWLAKNLRYPDPEEAYVAGLLHDIGKLLLDQFVLQDYQKIVQFVQQYQMPLWQVEEKLIGIDHASVGGLMANRWQFPTKLEDAIRCHHAPSLARVNQSLAAIVNLANSVSNLNNFETDIISNELHPETCNILKLTEQGRDKLMKGLMITLGNSND